jgi:hypothetical protein
MDDIADVNDFWWACWRRENDPSSRPGYSIEQAIRFSGLNDQAFDDVCYRVAYAVADSL